MKIRLDLETEVDEKAMRQMIETLLDSSEEARSLVLRIFLKDYDEELESFIRDNYDPEAIWEEEE